jgi:hypothetical protein
MARRHFLAQSAALAGLATALPAPLPAHDIAGTDALAAALPAPQPKPALPFVLEALARHQLVGLCEAHLLQEQHDFFGALLRQPALPSLIDDIVVEFGNALYQPIADQFILGDEPVANAVLHQIWRNTTISGGNPVWDAPVYEQFFRTVRAVNWPLPPSRRIRVLLGDPPIDWSTVRGAADIPAAEPLVLSRDAHYAQVVERKVLARGRRALLVAGGGHLYRGVLADNNVPGQPNPPNAATLLVHKYPGILYVIDIAIPAPGSQDPQDRLVSTWARPSIASLAGTWVGATPLPAGARIMVATTYGAMVDSLLYVGSGKQLTASHPDPSLYEGGAYAKELERRGKLYVLAGAQKGDALRSALALANAGPSYFAP